MVAPLLKLIADMMNGYLGLDPQSQALLTPLAGKVIAAQVKPLLVFYFSVEAGKLILLSQRPEVIDCEIAGSLPGLLSFAMAKGQHVVLAERGISVSGDMDVARDWSAVFSRLDIDWEEYLSRLVGDPIAHSTGHFIRSTLKWFGQLGGMLQANLTEYVQEEARCMPSRWEANDFMEAVDDVHSQLERVALRIARLQRQEDLPS